MGWTWRLKYWRWQWWRWRWWWQWWPSGWHWWRWYWLAIFLICFNSMSHFFIVKQGNCKENYSLSQLNFDWNRDYRHPGHIIIILVTSSSSAKRPNDQIWDGTNVISQFAAWLLSQPTIPPWIIAQLQLYICSLHIAHCTLHICSLHIAHCMQNTGK